MATTTTPVLGLVKPTPGTGEPYSRATENANLDAIDAAIGAKTTKFTTTTVGNTTAETSVFSVALPASPPQGAAWHMRIFGTYDNAASATNFTVRVKIGGSQLTAITVNTPASAQTFSGISINFDVILATTGVSGTWRGELWGYTSDSGSGTVPRLAVPGSGLTKDTTVSNNMEITVQWAAANASNVVRIDGGVFRRLTNA